MWSTLPAIAQEFIYDHSIPLKIAYIDESFDLPQQEVRVAGIAKQDDERLFIRSCKDNRDWEFPGGRLEGTESPLDAIQREFTEETGLEVNAAEPVLALVWVFPDSTIVQLVFHIDAGEQVGSPDEDEVCDIGWFGTLPEDISFGDAGHETYQVIIDSVPVTVSIDGPAHTLPRPDRKSLAVGGAVAGSAIAAGLARRVLRQRSDS